MKKRLLAVLTVAAMAVGLVGCQQAGGAGSSSSATSSAAVSSSAASSAAVSSAASSSAAASSAETSSQAAVPKSNDELYAEAVKDAVFIDPDEVLPLVNISKDDENVIWDDQGRVLVAFMHKYPDSYPAGQDIELKWGNVWCVSEKEMSKWVKDNSHGVDDWTTRLHQLLGMPTSKEYTHVTALWVDAKLLYRPANVSDPCAKMEAKYTPTGDEAFDKQFKEWFDSNIIWSYFDSAFPWTRLGYTYDWADNGKEYGLSEFLIFQGANAKVAYTYDLKSYVDQAKGN